MAAKASIPPFEATSIEKIPSIAKTARQTFRTHKTKNLEWRLVQLRKLYWAFEDLAPQMAAALQSDLGKSSYESYLTEIDWLKVDCMYMINQLKTLAKDTPLRSPEVPISFAFMNFRVRKEPHGAALIIGPYNYPFHLLLAPFVGAIAAGCTAVIKPSEAAPASAMVCVELLKRLDPSAYAVVNGAVAETAALLEEKWDKIFFTGGAQVGKIIAAKAAETLTPVCLELGGRNPAFVTKNANLAIAARRLLWAKCFNAGQVCLSQNYVLIDKAVVPTFIEHLKVAFAEFFPNGAKNSPDLSRIVNARHFARMKKMLDSSSGKIVLGGQMDEAELFIEPTAVLVTDMNDSMVREESFGPIFAIYPVNSLDEALNVANHVHRTPLALFTFGSKVENARVLDETTSGGACINDAFTHATLNAVPFGGVGDSGWGAYRGRASFDVWTHSRTISETPSWMEKLLRVRYMPYDMKNLPFYRRITSQGSPNFSRDGKVTKGLVYWAGVLLGLGAKGAKGAFLRWCVLFAAGWATLFGRK